MLSFYITTHARPPEASAGPTIELGGRSFATLSIPHNALSYPFSLSFETAVEQLSHFERLFCEPDGSFVWTSSHDSPPWQLDGNLFDRNSRLLFVDLKGNCPPAEFDRLLTALGWPETPLIFQLVREAIFLDEPEFRRWAKTNQATDECG